MVKTTQKSSFPEPAGRFPRNLVFTISDSSPSKFDKMIPWVDLDLFYGKVNFGNIGFYMGKIENYGFFFFFENDCNQRPEKIFFSETTWPIKLKFYVEPPCVAAFQV